MVFPPGLGKMPWLQLLAPGSEVSLGKPCCGHHQLPILVTGLLNPDWPWQFSGILCCQLPVGTSTFSHPGTCKSLSTGNVSACPIPFPCPSFPPQESFQPGV